MNIHIMMHNFNISLLHISMKRLLSFAVLSIFFCSSFLSFQHVFAADSTVVGFEIIAPTTATANEAIDITVRAIDKDKKTVTNYRWSILFILDNFWNTVPSPSKAIPFTAEDAWQKKFSKGIIFRSTGKQEISVTDLDRPNDISGETTVMVSAASTSSGSGQVGTETITIVTPVKDSQVISDIIAVSGKTKKNSKVIVTLNGKDVADTITDDSWLFTKTISWATQDKNLLQVRLIDGNNSVVAKSDDVIFGRTKATTGFYNIVIHPGTTVETSTGMSILVEGDAGMSTASVSIDWSLIPLKENQPWKYSANTSAPSKSGSYQIGVNMVSTLGQTIKNDNVATLIVNDPITVTMIPKFTNVKVVTEWKKVTFSFGITDAPKDLEKFKIAYGKDADSLSQEITTTPASKIQWTGWIYQWYIDKLEPDTYTFKIFGMKKDGSLVPLLVSEPLVVVIGKDAVAVANVGKITVTAEPWKSMMSWNPVACAVSYNVYKVSADWAFELVSNTKEPNYTVYFDTGTITKDNFAIKAICQDWVESTDYVQVSQVQTGPWILVILVIISGIMWFILLRRKSIS